MFYIGRIRRLLMVPGTHRWNAWIRDITARLGGTWFIRSIP